MQVDLNTDEDMQADPTQDQVVPEKLKTASKAQNGDGQNKMKEIKVIMILEELNKPTPPENTTRPAQTNPQSRSEVFGHFCTQIRKFPNLYVCTTFQVAIWRLFWVGDFQNSKFQFQEEGLNPRENA